MKQVETTTEARTESTTDVRTETRTEATTGTRTEETTETTAESGTQAQAEALVKFIAPAITFSGHRAFTVAVWKTAELFKTRVPDDIDFTKDVYPAAAREIQKSVGATERAIYRGAAFCWRKGSNDRLHQIIGEVLPEKPKPSYMLLYCAYYMTYNIPYHHAANEPSLPLPF